MHGQEHIVAGSALYQAKYYSSNGDLTNSGLRFLNHTLQKLSFLMFFYVPEY